MDTKHTRVQLRRMGVAAGFTLIELMVAVVIIAILAAAAYPSYREQVRRGHRAAVKGALLEDAQFLERNYTLNNCYHRTDGVCTSATANLILPVARLPATGTANYTIAVMYSAIAPCTLGQCFTLSAVPTGSMGGDSCGTLTLDQAGVQGANDVVCWQR
ncbi:type IV pilin protein [uncultured Thiodictyon sp.]|uniref:type IV pilin protein n=1 Tax=uncultured Thiodictyon sp. TaxID=1846217 RepID=UPI0025DB4E48|nr:type IV pilin protein [uncultured Thiodictyon sp.]